MKQCKCGTMAVWIYMPSSSEYPHYCDNCVPRGCTCNREPQDGNWDNLEESNWINPTDKQGREYPCCEFEYDKNGFEL
jgi:hypothetical protein